MIIGEGNNLAVTMGHFHGPSSEVAFLTGFDTSESTASPREIYKPVLNFPTGSYRAPVVIRKLLQRDKAGDSSRRATLLCI